MTGRPWLATAVLALLMAHSSAQTNTEWRDSSPHRIQFVTVAENVRLEVADWGGSGRPVVLLPGLGATAHTFDDFAPRLAHDCQVHVYGITRRGFGASSVPATGYRADQLGDDVLAVLDSLKLNSPVLVGSSFAGAELSSVGSHKPGRVAGLVYLDAAYPYAFDNGKGWSLEEFMKQEIPQPPPSDAADLASFAAYQAWLRGLAGVVPPEADIRQTMESGADGSVRKPRAPAWVTEAVFSGMRKFTEISVPVLAIYALPTDRSTWLEHTKDAAAHARGEAYLARLRALTEKQAGALEEGVVNARVVRLPGAKHLVFLSNEVDVLREMHTFLASLM